MVVIQFYFQSEKQSEVGWVGMTIMLFLVEKFPGEKGSVMVCCREATASSFVAKVLGKVFTHFHAVAVKRHSTTHN
jgi:hypothetical protein